MAWFKTWFDSPYYHLLYKDRDYSEAEIFISHLMDYLKPNKDDHFLDLACGKGRHALHVNKLGFKIDGCDYSSNSIAHAKQFENERLRFYEHDKRIPLPKTYSNILNLFTSFGYFESEEEHQTTLQNVFNGLEDGGNFVFDFMNSSLIIDQLVPEETITKDNTTFFIHRRFDGKRIVKNIRIEDGENSHEYQEEVRAFMPDHLEQMMKDCGFQIASSFGDYNLNPFDLLHSKRLIYHLEKI